MTVTTRPITAEELLNMPSDQRRELVKGEVRAMAPSGFDHGAVIDNLQFALSKHVREHKLGLVLGAETGFRLTTNPDTVRGADVSFVRAARIPATGRPTTFWPGAPDLTVEVVSPGDKVYEVDEKVEDYLNAGTPLVWVVNPRQRTVTVHRASTPPIILTEPDALDAGDVIPHFRMPVRDIFT